MREIPWREGSGVWPLSGPFVQSLAEKSPRDAFPADQTQTVKPPYSSSSSSQSPVALWQNATVYMWERACVVK